MMVLNASLAIECILSAELHYPAVLSTVLEVF